MGGGEPVETQGNEKVEKPRILVVDDSKLVRITAERILTEQFDVVIAENGEDAWRKLIADSSIQVVFTDLGMPELDGYGLIKRVRHSEQEAIRNLPMIVITGAAEEEGVRRKVFELGATDFITKPFKSTEIIARAEAHANYRRDKDQLQKSVDLDLVTGTLNRAGLDEQLERDVSFINRHGENLALLMLELDGFELIAERIGQQGAERVIKQAATVLSSAIRKEDSIGRAGLAQFLIILPMAKTEGVVMLAKRLCGRIKGFKISAGGESLPLTLSVGIAAVSKGNRATVANLFQTAEQALKNAKLVGRGEVQLLKLDSDQNDEAPEPISIDTLLDTVSAKPGDIAPAQIEAAIARLAPLVVLMSAEQRQRLLTLK